MTVSAHNHMLQRLGAVTVEREQLVSELKRRFGYTTAQIDRIVAVELMRTHTLRPYHQLAESFLAAKQTLERRRALRGT